MQKEASEISIRICVSNQVIKESKTAPRNAFFNLYLKCYIPYKSKNVKPNYFSDYKNYIR